MMTNRDNNISVADRALNMTVNGSRVGSPIDARPARAKYQSFRRGKKSVVPATQSKLTVEDVVNTSMNK